MRSIVKLISKCKGNIKMYLMIIDRGDGCWTELAQNRVRTCTLILELLNIQIMKRKRYLVN
jgi:hypothetical protein